VCQRDRRVVAGISVVHRISEEMAERVADGTRRGIFAQRRDATEYAGGKNAGLALAKESCSSRAYVRAYRNSALCDANVTQAANARVAQLARKRKSSVARARARRGVPYKNAERSGDVDGDVLSLFLT